MLTSMMRVHLDVLEAKSNVALAHDADALVVRLQGYVWAEEIQNETASLTVEWPASVWQAFKDRWFPAWALRRWPVKLASSTQIFKFTVKATLPDYKYIAPGGSRVVIKAFGDAPYRFRGDKPEIDE